METVKPTSQVAKSAIVQAMSHQEADFFIPDGQTTLDHALARTTHLAIGAHQDDLEIMAYHGIASCYRKQDQWFSGITVTDGAGSLLAGPYQDYSEDKIRQLRSQEQRKAAQLGEYSCQVQLVHSSAAVKAIENAVINDLFMLLEASEAETVYLHNPMDKHQTHIAVFICALEALRRLPQAKRPNAVYGCEVWRDLDWLCDDDKVLLDTTGPKGLDQALIQVFKSQLQDKHYDRAVLGRRAAHLTFASSHALENTDISGVTYAVDLLPLLQNVNLSVQDYCQAMLDRFVNEVRAKLSACLEQ